MQELTARFKELAKANGGHYDGWSAAVVFDELRHAPDRRRPGQPGREHDRALDPAGRERFLCGACPAVRDRTDGSFQQRAVRDERLHPSVRWDVNIERGCRERGHHLYVLIGQGDKQTALHFGDELAPAFNQSGAAGAHDVFRIAVLAQIRDHLFVSHGVIRIGGWPAYGSIVRRYWG